MLQIKSYQEVDVDKPLHLCFQNNSVILFAVYKTILAPFTNNVSSIIFIWSL